MRNYFLFFFLLLFFNSCQKDAKNNIDGFTAKDNLITGKSKAKEISGAVQPESWKESY